MPTARLTGVLLPLVLGPAFGLMLGENWSDDRAARNWLEFMAGAGAGVAVVALAAVLLLPGRPFRVQGLVPPAATVWLAAAGYSWATETPPGWVAGLAAGVAWLASAAYPRVALTGRDLWLHAGACCAGAAAAGVLATRPALGPTGPWLTGLTGLLAVGCWYLLFRPVFELFWEPVLWVMYAVRAGGPGLEEIPARGPCLVVANHACWADPFFIAKVLPRPITPVMTAAFYDRPVISWLMRRVVKAIRVPEKPLKQDVPQEIKEVIAALDRGECVVLFPEGYLRRSEERPLRRFGRGVWQVLTARPDTPVFPCWIEGGWGSYTSYQNGPPTKNKRPDVRRPIKLAVGSPVTIGPDELAHHLATRIDLMNRVAACRTLLGLPEVPAFELPKAGEDTEPAADV